MRKITTLLALLILLVSQGAFAQRTISGRVISGEDGLPMPGVTVLVRGTTTGTATDINGNFSLNVPNDAIIIVSFMGFRAIEQAVGNQTTFTFTLQPDVLTLGDVVVTALGIQRETKTLTYSAQQVSGAEMMQAKDMNFMNALSGKAAGLEIKRSASGAGGSTRTQLRGAKSFNDVGNPLYVIDGVPMVNRVLTSAGIGGGYDQGDGLSALNPDDIESISVLKGANAAILYGSAGANGVVMITTKKGSAGTVNISISNATTFENVMVWPELQYKYGADSPNGKENWHLKPFTAPTQPGGLVPQWQNGFTEKDFKDFLNTGHNIVNNISISGGAGNTTVYFSYANTLAKGIIRNNSYRKDNVTLRQSTKILNNKVTISTNVMFNDEMRYNTPANGSYMNSLNSLAWFPRNRNIAEFRDEIIDPATGHPIVLKETTGGASLGGAFTNNPGLAHGWRMWDDNRKLYQMNWHVSDHYQSNPWWLTNVQPRWDGNRRVIAGANITWDITSNLKFTVKGNYDYANRVNEHQHAAKSNATNVSPNGTWNFSQTIDRMQYTDALLQYNNNFGDFSLNALAGIAYQETAYGKGMSVNTGSATALLLPNIFTLQNVDPSVTIGTSAGSQTIKEGYFANGSFGYKEMIFLDLSGRYDRSSTLAGTDYGVGYFYPAAGLSAIVSQMVSLPSFVTFGKVRGSYTVVANEVGFDNIFQRMSINSRQGGVSAPSQPDWTDAKPELLTSIEFGTDWRFLEGRVGFDFTYYDITSTDQRMTPTVIRGYGFRQKTINTGKLVNRGIELLLDAEPVSTGDFSWKTSINFARNKNKVVAVSWDDPKYFIESRSSAYVWRIVNGGTVGDLYSYDFARDKEGRILVDTDYKPIKTPTWMYMGTPHPDFNLGWNNSFTYKRWSMGFLINGVFGGKVASYTQSWYDIYGVSKRTADARDKGYIEVNAIVHGPAEYDPMGVLEHDEAWNHGQILTRLNAIEPDEEGNPIKALEYWYRTLGGENGIFSNYFYDRTNIRLTQFSLNYDLPVRAWNLPLKSASVGLVGQNLFFLYKNAPYDPELAMSTTGVGSAAVDNFGLPATRTYGFNIKINF